MGECERQTGVHLRGVNKGFGEGETRIEVLHGIDLDVKLGEILLVAGPSGSGKTTLLCLMAGLLDADAGSICVFGTNLQALAADDKTALRAKEIGFVFQQFNLLPALSALENAAIPLLVQGRSRREALARAAANLEHVGLQHRLRSSPANLSGGEQQRVAIARALATNPRLLICDEPTAALDGETGAKIMTVLRETALRPDRSIVLVTHDNRVFHFGDRLARITDGRILSVEAIQAARRAGQGDEE